MGGTFKFMDMSCVSVYTVHICMCMLPNTYVAVQVFECN